MTTNNAREVVDRYFTALTMKDFVTMRSLLDDDVTFVGPLGTTDNAEQYIDALTRVTTSMVDIRRHALFADGEDVCQIYDLTLSAPDATLPVAQWLKVRDNRITAVRLYFDARPYA
jgi:limonene-1,2-epoxide hydrolase